MRNFMCIECAQRHIVASALLLTVGVAVASTVTLDKLPPIRGIALHAEGLGMVYVATREGLFLAGEDRKAQKITSSAGSLISLVPHPSTPSVLYASGHGAGGANLGLMQSRDGGRTWRQVSPGANGPAGFQALTVSLSNPRVLYGQSSTLQISQDAGESWTRLPRIPSEVYALAVSARDSRTIYAATQTGILRSTDGGKRWQTLSEATNPATMVHVTAEGTVYAFVAGRGLLQAQEPALTWKTINNQLGEQLLLQLAVDPKDAKRIYALNHFGRLLVSHDTGRTWHAFGGDRGPRSPAGLRGEKLYRRHCQACHGLRGVGETHSERSLSDPRYRRAPALDDSTHAWHHSDENLVNTILEGSAREPRMKGFKDTLSKADALDLVAYMKSLWGPRALACQGPLHMDRECLASH